jgi:hypothetical protein
MNTRPYGVGRFSVAVRSYRRPGEARWFGTTVMSLPFSLNPEDWDRVRQVRVGPLLFAWAL